MEREKGGSGPAFFEENYRLVVVVVVMVVVDLVPRGHPSWKETKWKFGSHLLSPPLSSFYYTSIILGIALYYYTISILVLYD
jgi:hypothetical protein